MTTGAWIMLVLAWGSIISLAIFCIYKTLQSPPRATEPEDADVQKERVQ
jgi:hypothetical protein